MTARNHGTQRVKVSLNHRPGSRSHSRPTRIEFVAASVVQYRLPNP